MSPLRVCSGDAPEEMTGPEAEAWAAGWNAGVERTFDHLAEPSEGMIGAGLPNRRGYERHPADVWQHMLAAARKEAGP